MVFQRLVRERDNNPQAGVSGAHFRQLTGVTGPRKMGNREHRSVGGSGLGAASSSEMDGKAPLATARSAAEDEEGFRSQGDVGDVDESRDHLCDPFLSLSFLTRPSTPSTSLQLPFFNTSVSKDDDQSGDHSAPDNDANDISYDNYYNSQCFYNSNSNTITTATTTTSHTQTLFYTFFLSPTASTSSVVSSVWSSPGPSSDTDSDETHTTMPGPTYDGPTDQFPPPTPIATEYCDNFACASAEQTPSRPQTAKHGRSFSRWGRRNQSPSNVQTLRLCGRRSLDLPGMRASPKRPGHSRSSSIQKLQAQAAAVPQMSRDEFEALPLAIQRKVCTENILLLTSTSSALPLPLPSRERYPRSRAQPNLGKSCYWLAASAREIMQMNSHFQHMPTPNGILPGFDCFSRNVTLTRSPSPNPRV